MRPRRHARPTLIVLSAIVLAGPLVLSAGAAIADDAVTPTATCDGKPATIVTSIPKGGPNLVNGTEGDDVIVVTSGVADVYGLGGNDTICGGPDGSTLYGGAGDDVLIGGDGDDYLAAGDGADVLYGGAGNDFLAGENGDDVLYGGTGGDRLYGSAGDDTLYGEAGVDTLNGEDGDDALFGGGSRDLLIGGLGTDRLDGGTGIDYLYAGYSRYRSQYGDAFFVEPEPTSPQRATVTGAVTSASGKAIRGAKVQFRLAAGPTIYHAATSSSGHFSASVPGVSYIVRVSAPGFATKDVTSVAAPGGTTTTSVTLRRLGTLTGRLLDVHGQPIRDATVAYSGATPGKTTTSKSGRWEADVPAGTYGVTAEAAHYATTELQAAAQVRAARTTPLGSTVLHPAGAVTGHLYDEAGDPLPGLAVVLRLRDGSGNQIQFAYGETDERGYFHVGRLTAGRWEIVFAEDDDTDSQEEYASQTSHVRVHAGKTTAHTDATLHH